MGKLRSRGGHMGGSLGMRKMIWKEGSRKVVLFAEPNLLFFLKIRVNSNKLPWSLGLYQQSLELFKSNQIGPSTQFGP